MQLFYTTDIDAAKGTLHDQEAVHCTKVLRHRVGDRIHVVDGRGGSYVTEIAAIHRNQVKLIVHEKKPDDDLSGPTLPILAFGILKSDTRTEWMVEKLVEIGVSGLAPLICGHSEKRRIRKPRLEKIMVSAMKQSKRSRLPTLEEPQPFESWLLNQPVQTTFIAHGGIRHPGLLSIRKNQEAVTLVIGPEGDFSKDELELIRKSGFSMYNLGSNRLRSETAAITSCTLWNLS